MLERDSSAVGAPATPRSGSCDGGLRPEEVARAVQRTGARVVHAHNVNPTFGPRALEAAREPRAPGSCCTCTTTGSCARSAPASRAGEDCTRCHGRNTLPGLQAQLPRRLAGRVRRLRRGPRAASAAADGRRRRDRRPERVRAATGCATSARRSAATAQVLGSVQRTFAHALDAPRPASSCSPRAGSRRRRASRTSSTRARRPACRSSSPATARSAPSSRPARRRADALHRPRPGRRARGAAGRGRRSPSCPAATPRSFRSPRWRRWPPALPTVAARSGGLVEAVPEEGLYPPGDIDALAARLTALYRRRRGRRARARRRARPQRARGHRHAAASDLRRGPKLHGRDEVVRIMLRRVLPFLLLVLALRSRASADAAVSHEEGHLGPGRDRRAIAVPGLQGPRRRDLPDHAQVGRGRRVRAAGRAATSRTRLRLAGSRSTPRSPRPSATASRRADRHRRARLGQRRQAGALWPDEARRLRRLRRRRRQALPDRPPLEHLGRPVAQGQRSTARPPRATPACSTAPTSKLKAASKRNRVIGGNSTATSAHQVDHQAQAAQRQGARAWTSTATTRRPPSRRRAPRP